MTDEKDSKKRTPASYPAASLNLCLSKAALAMEAMPGLGAVPRAWATQDEFAKACGYKGFDANSAPKGLMAAMAHFGLIEKDSIKRIRFKPELISAMASEEARADLIERAVKRPKIHQALFLFYGSVASPSRVEIAKHLSEECGFAERPAQIMASNFIEDLALLRSVQSDPVHLEVAESVKTPSGALIRMSYDRPLSSADLEFLEKFIRLKRGLS